MRIKPKPIGKINRFTVSTHEEYLSIIDRSLSGVITSFDCETTSLDQRTNHLVGASFGFKNKDGSHDTFYVPIGHKVATSIDLFLQPPPSNMEEYKNTKVYRKMKSGKLAREEQQKQLANKKNKNPEKYRDPSQVINWELAPNQIDLNFFLKGIIRLFNSKKVTLVGHNIGFDIKQMFFMFKRQGFKKFTNFYLHCTIVDTMCCYYLLHWNLTGGHRVKNSNKRLDKNLKLKWLSLDVLGYAMTELHEVCPVYENIPYLQIHEITSYAQDDVFVPRELYEYFLAFVAQEIQTNGQHAKKLFVLEKVEMPAMKALLTMEFVGTKVNPQKLIELDYKYKAQAENIEKKCLGLIKKLYLQAKTKNPDLYVDFENINLRSNSAMGVLLFDTLKCWKPRKGRQAWEITKTGSYSVGKENLEDLCYREYGLCINEDAYELAETYAKLSSIHTIRSNFTSKLPFMVSEGNRIHPSYKQFFTVTTRLSCSDPNLQNIPSRGEKGKEIRSCFIPEDGWEWGSNDASGQEMRILAHLTRNCTDREGNPIDNVLITLFNSGNADIHQKTADGLNISRDKSKTINYGTMYGVGPKKLGRDLRISSEKAKGYLEELLVVYPEIEYYGRAIEYVVSKKSYTTTICGNTRDYTYYKQRNWYWKNKAKNHPVQGSAADIIKLALGNIYQELIEKKLLFYHVNLLLQVHDEIDYEVDPVKKEEVTEIVKRHMETSVELVVPSPAGTITGSNWSECK